MDGLLPYDECKPSRLDDLFFWNTQHKQLSDSNTWCFIVHFCGSKERGEGRNIHFVRLRRLDGFCAEVPSTAINKEQRDKVVWKGDGKDRFSVTALCLF